MYVALKSLIIFTVVALLGTGYATDFNPTSTQVVDGIVAKGQITEKFFAELGQDLTVRPTWTYDRVLKIYTFNGYQVVNYQDHFCVFSQNQCISVQDYIPRHRYFTKHIPVIPRGYSNILNGPPVTIYNNYYIYIPNKSHLLFYYNNGRFGAFNRKHWDQRDLSLFFNVTPTLHA
ncbi:uncharacterized protein MELLADRAFT_112516 [Melampsora larici-populina 98AG31]|uniref:Secreted protein n=1 Tax=Melampsora larici-populina (strain 98AG31 / pathotype 3-4-7) TaxID=747676 RepID=F4S6Q9_MELLP|nr:uncharacterized protein MELLADRAFT_112516 [Melampsora larici-populina 98AG31]EGF99676.1 secreted protein [Melampsora larici-populina 98AG31]